MDAAVATLIGSGIAGLTAIITVFLTNWFNLRQTKANMESRLTEVAFTSRLQAYSELAAAMQAVNASYVLLYIALTEWRATRKLLAEDEHLAERIPGDPLLDGELISATFNAASTFNDTFFRVRMYLTPEMDAIAERFINDYIIRMLVTKPRAESYPCSYAEQVWADQLNTEASIGYVSEMTTAMRKYIDSVEARK